MKQIVKEVKKMKKNNPKEEAIRARRKAFYSKAWDVQLDPKKMHNQDLKNNIKKWIRHADAEKKKVTPKVDVESISSSISKGMNNYMELKKGQIIIDTRPQDFGKKFHDDDLNRGLGALVPIQKEES